MTVGEDMKYGYVNPDGSISIDSVAVFCDALQHRNPLSISRFSDFFADCEQLVRSEFSATQGAINNVRGNWYEWLITIGSIHFSLSNPVAKAMLVQLPNVRSLDYMSLYDAGIYKYIEDLRQKTSVIGVSLISSNPDYAIIKNFGHSKLPSVNQITPQCIATIDLAYQGFLGALEFDDILGFASVKTSLRPDRRLQLSHEGALVKAFYEHLKGRLWKVDAAGLKYYGISMEVKASDIEGLKTVATHSILSVNTKPEAAVDAVFQVANGQDLLDLLSSILV
jgi:hypothetical protein